MKSKNEEYLDSLLNSVAKQNNNAGRMFSARENSTEQSEKSAGSQDIDDLAQDDNADAKEISELLKKVDSNELVDDRLGDMLDTFSKEDSAMDNVPRIKVGSATEEADVRDEEERELDEEIANAEQMLKEQENAARANESGNKEEIENVQLR